MSNVKSNLAVYKNTFEYKFEFPLSSINLRGGEEHSWPSQLLNGSFSVSVVLFERLEDYDNRPGFYISLHGSSIKSKIYNPRNQDIRMFLFGVDASVEPNSRPSHLEVKKWGPYTSEDSSTVTNSVGLDASKDGLTFHVGYSESTTYKDIEVVDHTIGEDGVMRHEWYMPKFKSPEADLNFWDTGFKKLPDVATEGWPLDSQGIFVDVSGKEMSDLDDMEVVIDLKLKVALLELHGLSSWNSDNRNLEPVRRLFKINWKEKNVLKSGNR